MLAGWTLDDVGARLPWRALGALVRHAPPTSALFRELHPEEAGWLDGSAVAPILADVYDAVQGTAYIVTKANVKHGTRVPAPQPYPRPGSPARGGGARHYGGGALPPDELTAWLDAH